MTQIEIAAACNHLNKRIRTQHGHICVDCWHAYFDARPRRTRQHRQIVPAWGDYATIAMISRRRK